jgi:hypothetical protein
METKLNIKLGRELEADEVENESGTGTIGAGIQAGIKSSGTIGAVSQLASMPWLNKP